MRFNKPLNHILDSQTKTICLRLLCNHPTEINGRQLSKIVKLSPTTVHKAMKELANEQIIILKNYGNSHVYELNKDNRIVAEILKPMFNKEKILLDSFIKNIVRGIKRSGFINSIFSIVLFGSVQKGTEKPGSDIDLCVVVKEQKDKKRVENLIFNMNSGLMIPLGMGIEPYVKTISEFKKDKGLGVIKSILKSHRIVWGERLEGVV
ncbi:MAG: nucleotidyltransferase domain-containing protein [Candidatus Omnitrophota bacterium]|nr:nucleotidyltransferase domain-containing protein [Candidatus Omnitrophota bacterium]